MHKIQGHLRFQSGSLTGYLVRSWGYLRHVMFILIVQIWCFTYLGIIEGNVTTEIHLPLETLSLQFLYACSAENWFSSSCSIEKCVKAFLLIIHYSFIHSFIHFISFHFISFHCIALRFIWFIHSFIHSFSSFPSLPSVSFRFISFHSFSFHFHSLHSSSPLSPRHLHLLNKRLEAASLLLQQRRNQEPKHQINSMSFKCLACCLPFFFTPSILSHFHSPAQLLLYLCPTFFDHQLCVHLHPVVPLDL